MAVAAKAWFAVLSNGVYFAMMCVAMLATAFIERQLVTPISTDPAVVADNNFKTYNQSREVTSYKIGYFRECFVAADQKFTQLTSLSFDDKGNARRTPKEVRKTKNFIGCINNPDTVINEYTKEEWVFVPLVLNVMAMVTLVLATVTGMVAGFKPDDSPLRCKVFCFISAFIELLTCILLALSLVYWWLNSTQSFPQQREKWERNYNWWLGYSWWYNLVACIGFMINMTLFIFEGCFFKPDDEATANGDKNRSPSRNSVQPAEASSSKTNGTTATAATAASSKGAAKAV